MRERGTMRTIRFLLLFGSAFVLLHAQNLLAGRPAPTGDIVGVVINKQTREPLPGAAVSLIGTTFGASTDLEGRFRIAGVPEGSYRIQASSLGFETVILTDIIATGAREATLTIELIEKPILSEEVLIEASYFPGSSDAGASAQAFTYEEIRRSPGGFEDVFRAVSVLPGVVQVDGGRNDLIVRGGAPSENLFFVDNIEIPNINHFGSQGSTGGPLSFINLDFVRETNFSSGGFGVRYGDKLSSVLGITLREGRTDRFGGKLTLSATQFGLNAEGGLGDAGSFLFSARRSYLDFIFKAAGFSFVPEYWDFIGKATYNLDAHNLLSFLSIGALDNVSFNNASREDRIDNSRILGNDQNQYVSGLSWRHLFGEGFGTITVGRSYVRYAFLQSDSLGNPLFVNNSTESDVSLRADFIFQPAAGTEYAFGAIGKRLRTAADIRLQASITGFGDRLEPDPVSTERMSYKAAAYAQFARTFLPRLKATAGVRFDYFGMIEKPAYLSPRLSLTYDLTPLWQINAAAGRYYQSPSAVWIVGNPENRRLRALRADQFVLGVSHIPRPDTRIGIEGYVKEYADYPASLLRPYLVLANTGAGFGGSEEGFASFGLDPLASAGSGRARGAELSIRKRFSDVPCYGIASLTWSEARYRAIDGIERAGAYDQRWIVSVSGGYKLDARWEAGMKFRFASGRPFTPFNPDGSRNPAAYNADRLPASHALDIRIDRRWEFARASLITYLDIQNVYNHRIVSGLRWDPLTGRVEKVESIGILPSIGVSLEF